VPVERMYERDVDLLLAEELAVHPAFADHFKSLTKFADEPAAVTEFWVSKSNSLGESDLVVVYQRSDGKPIRADDRGQGGRKLAIRSSRKIRMRAERERSKGIFTDSKS